MKIILIFLTFIFVSNSLFSQTKRELDSLKMVVDTTKQDTARVMALCRLSYYETDPSKGFRLVNDALVLTRKIKFEKGEAQCFHQLGNEYNGIGDYSRSMEYHFKALRIREHLEDHEGIATSLSSIGVIYFFIKNYDAALTYYMKSAEVLKKINIPYRWISLNTFIGNAYEKKQQFDSALVYLQKAYTYGMTTNSKYWLSAPLRGLGTVHSDMGSNELASSYFRQSIANCQEYNNPAGLMGAYLGLAKLYDKTLNIDSALHYSHLALSIAQKIQYRQAFIDIGKLLSKLYENKDDKAALQYHKMAMSANDSIYNAASLAQIQGMTFTEQERQREINEAKLKAATERRHNLQYAGIAIAIISFVILFFALSRSIVVKTKFIEFFGMLGLLAVFEFINLLIHPYLAHTTNDSPVLMLIVLIAIAALLIPLHHKLQHWITGIMVEKNKKIRLAAAKKTIAKLEPAFPEISAGKSE